MTNILVVGDGYGAITATAAHLAIGAHVTLLSQRSPDEIHSGPVLSSQVLFGRAPAAEKALGLRGPFDPLVPQIRTVCVSLGSGLDTPVIKWRDTLDPPATSVDQRDWLYEGFKRVAACGARIERCDWSDHQALRAELTRRAQTYDLIIVTSSGLADAVFPPDPAFGPPVAHRLLQMAYVHGATPIDRSVHFKVVVPDAAARPYGELIVLPALSRNEPVTIVLIEGVPGGVWDARTHRADQWGPREAWAHMQGVLPDDIADWFATAKLTDPGGILRGQVTQCARYPLVSVSGTPVLALGDAAMTLDPVSARGAWKAVLDAQDAADALRPDGVTPQALTGLIQRIGHRNLSMWRYTNTLLSRPESVRTMFAAAQTDAATRRLLTAGFADPVAMEGTAFYGAVPVPEGQAA